MFDFLIDIVPREEAISKSELGMKRRTARMKEKKEEERKRKRQEELEEAYAYSQAQAHSQIPHGANAKSSATAGAMNSTASVPPHARLEAATQARSAETPAGQLIRPHNHQRDGEMPVDKRRREA